jgi:hypothetical protein
MPVFGQSVITAIANDVYNIVQRLRISGQVLNVYITTVSFTPGPLLVRPVFQAKLVTYYIKAHCGCA